MALLLGVQVAFNLVSVADEIWMPFSLPLHAHMEEEEEPKSKQNQQGQETKHQTRADSAPRPLEGDFLSCHLSAAPFFCANLTRSTHGKKILWSCQSWTLLMMTDFFCRGKTWPYEEIAHLQKNKNKGCTLENIYCAIVQKNNGPTQQRLLSSFGVHSSQLLLISFGRWI